MDACWIMPTWVGKNAWSCLTVAFIVECVGTSGVQFPYRGHSDWILLLSGERGFFEQCYDYNCSVTHQYTLQCALESLPGPQGCNNVFPWEIALVLCECFFLFSADTPGSFKEAGFVASTIIFLEVAVIVCNPLLPLSACKGSWLVLGSPEKSDVIQVNQLRKKKKNTAEGWQDGW